MILIVRTVTDIELLLSHSYVFCVVISIVCCHRITQTTLRETFQL